MIDNIRRLLDEGNYVFGVFIDLSKAFDTVDHEILLLRLNYYGIRGHANDFFRSYLTNRRQFVIVNGVKSGLKEITCGVPQGSVLGPILFLIYINDLFKAIGDDELLRLFADDTGLFNYDKDLTALLGKAKKSFIDLYKWCESNKLTINNDKTCFLLFHTRKKKIPPEINKLFFEELGFAIKRCSTIQYLGLLLDENLSWQPHIEHVCKSLVKYFGIFNQIKYFVSKVIARQLYFAFVYSRIKYGIEVYGNCADYLLNKVQIMQNKLLKLLLRIDYRTHTSALHKGLNILLVKDIYEANILSFVNDCLTGNCPDYFAQYFSYHVTGYNVRCQGLLKIERTKTMLAHKGCFVQGAVLWNHLDTCLNDKKYKMCFKKSVARYMIGNYTL